MDALSYSDTRARLKEVMDRDVEDRTPVVVTRKGGESVVMVSLADWSAMEETLHLVSSPANARRLAAANTQPESGAGSEHELLEP